MAIRNSKSASRKKPSPAKYLSERWRWLYKPLVIADEFGKYEKAMLDFDHSIVPTKGRATSLLDINWLSFADLDANEHLMDVEKSSCIRALCDEKYHNNNKDSKNCTAYMGNTILAVMADFEYGKDMCRCGTIGIGNVEGKKPCSKRIYCDRCANRKRRYIFQKYNGAYDESKQSYFVTFTTELEKKIIFEDGNLEQILKEWDKLNGYVDKLHKAKIMIGGLRSEELSLDRLYPRTLVNPHLHVLCQGTRLEELDKALVDGVKIHVSRIKDHDHWQRSLDYMFKVMDYHTTYVADWSIENAETVNRNLREFLSNFKFTALNRNQFRAFGSMQARNKLCTAECIKNVKPGIKRINALKGNTSLQKEGEKINCVKTKLKTTSAFLNKGAGRNTYMQKHALINNQQPAITPTAPAVNTMNPFLAAYADRMNANKGITPPASASAPVNVEEPKKPTPWYKNPWLIGGGSVAGLGALYGAGKLYHGGDNAINHSFEGIKNWFSGPTYKTEGMAEPTLPAPKVNNQSWEDATNDVNNPHYKGLYSALLNREGQLGEYYSRLKSHTSNMDTAGTNFEGVEQSTLNKEVGALTNHTLGLNALTPEKFKEYVSFKTGKPVTDALVRETLDKTRPDDLLSWLHQNSQGTTADKVVGAANTLANPVYAADAGVSIGGPIISHFRKFPWLEKAMGISSKAALPLAAAFGATEGYSFGRDLDADDSAKIPGTSTTWNTARHAVSGALLPVLTGAAGGAAAGTGLIPGAGTFIGGITGALAYPAAHMATGIANKNFETGMATMANESSLMSQFRNALNQLNNYHNPLPLSALKETALFKKYTEDPNAFRAYSGMLPTGEQFTDSSLSQLMNLKNTTDLTTLFGKSTKDLIDSGRRMIGNKDYTPYPMDTFNSY